MACVVRRRGRWVVDFRDPRGYRMVETVVPPPGKNRATKRDAEALLATRITQMSRGEYVPRDEQHTFDALAISFLDHKSGEIKRTTFTDYRQLIELHLKATFSGYPLRKISREMINAFRTKKREDGLGLRTINKTLTLLSSMFNHALESQWVGRNPVIGIKPLKIENSFERIHCLDPAEISRLMAVYTPAEEKWRILVWAAANTGLRQGELLGLQWRDINWKMKQIHVTRQYSAGRFSDLKTAASRRAVDISDQLAADLRQWQTICPKSAIHLVFPNGNGNPENHGNLMNRGFDPMLGRAGLPKIRFHDLRHGYASLLILNGEHPKYIQKQMGHSSVKITMDIYGHLMQSWNPEAANRLTNLILSGNKVVTGSGGGGSGSGLSAENYMVPRGGIEPSTHGFSVRCSTN